MIEYKVGDATDPKGVGYKIIAHICNDVGGFGKGFVISLANRWPQSRSSYKDWFKGEGANPPFTLGQVQFLSIPEGGVVIANMLAQRGLKGSGCKVQYGALRKCLKKVAVYAKRHDVSIHMPKIGAGLGGGDWNIISSIIEEELKGLSVTIYALKKD